MTPITRRTFTWLAALAPAALSRAFAAIWNDVGRLGGGEHELTLLYTNDFHSAFDPIPAYWLPGSPRLGGAAHLATLIDRQRAAARTTFLLDSGDMFTGTMSVLTQGEALMEMMTVMGYDAMGVGNHEFDYGWEVFERQITRVPFPVLCCNVRHLGARSRFCRPYTLLERNGVRLGVIGVMGSRAAKYTIMPSKVEALQFTDPVAETAACVEALRPAVDLVVVLAHQGLPGPMQTDAENDPAVQRPLDEDLAFCGAIPGIDVYIAAHSHHGLETPLVHPESGTLLVQTYGYGTRLGALHLKLRDRRVVAHRGELLKVWSDELPAHPAVTARVGHYQRIVAGQIGADIGRATARFVRKYNTESPLGSFVADVMRERARCDVGVTNAGGLRADLPAGGLHRGHVLDALPFINTVVALELSGRDLRGVVEQGASLTAGMVQVSGLRAVYDLARPVGGRVLDLRVGDRPVEDDRRYRVATNSFLAEGGDRYDSLRNGRELSRDALISDCVVDHLRAAGTIAPPPPGRLIPERPRP
jgi:5'-nucleotidase/UDP-sugar diphosphatase